jgi:hypothetical protein
VHTLCNDGNSILSVIDALLLDGDNADGTSISTIRDNDDDGANPRVDAIVAAIVGIAAVAVDDVDDDDAASVAVATDNGDVDGTDDDKVVEDDASVMTGNKANGAGADVVLDNGDDDGRAITYHHRHIMIMKALS